jgi:hypothetical protein
VYVFDQVIELSQVGVSVAEILKIEIVKIVIEFISFQKQQYGSSNSVHLVGNGMEWKMMWKVHWVRTISLNTKARLRPLHHHNLTPVPASQDFRNRVHLDDPFPMLSRVILAYLSI